MDPHAPCDLLLLGGTHVLVDESMRDISDGALAIDDGRIVAVGERAALEKAMSEVRRLARQTGHRKAAEGG